MDCGFLSNRGASLSNARTGIFNCLNFKSRSEKFMLPKEIKERKKMSMYWCNACPIKELSIEGGERARIQGISLGMCSLLFVLWQRWLKSKFLY